MCLALKLEGCWVESQGRRFIRWSVSSCIIFKLLWIKALTAAQQVGQSANKCKGCGFKYQGAQNCSSSSYCKINEYDVRSHCVLSAALGADLGARDPGRKLTSLEWAVFTGRHETVRLMTRLLARPCPEQFSESYRLEWPPLPDPVATTNKQKGCLRKVTEAIRNSFFFRTQRELQENGMMDHMVRLTTGIGSPFVATACQTVCPGSPPRVGKRRYSVQEILKKQRAEQLKNLGSEHLDSYKKLFQNSQVTLVPRKKERRASLQCRDPAGGDALALRRGSLLPLHLMRRRSVRPGTTVPRVRVTKAPAPLYVPEKEQEKNGPVNENLLQIPKWRYKEQREERKKMEEAERKKREAPSEKKHTCAGRRT